MIGCATKKNKVIILSFNATIALNQEEYFKILVHELAHCIVDQNLKPKTVSDWIVEGLAVTLAEQKIYTNNMKKDYKEKKYPKINKDNYINYNYSAIYVKKLIELLGIKKFKDIYVRPNQLNDYFLKGLEEEAIKENISF